MTNTTNLSRIVIYITISAKKNSSEDIKAKVEEIYRNKNFSDEEKIRKIRAKTDEAEMKGLWKGVSLGFGVCALLTTLNKFFKK